MHRRHMCKRRVRVTVFPIAALLIRSVTTITSARLIHASPVRVHMTHYQDVVSSISNVMMGTTVRPTYASRISAHINRMQGLLVAV